MAITAFFEIRIRPETLDQGIHAELQRVLNDTRAFEGCLGVELLIDSDDPTHIVAVEKWASDEHDAAYRAWRAADGKPNLAPYLVSAPVRTKFISAADV